MQKSQNLPRIAVVHSVKVLVKAGQKYAWCSCGLSKSQPFCDNSHKGTGFSPVIYESIESKMVSFCGCKHSSSGVLCDGSHNKISNHE